jgi:hypothetical protein
MGESFIVKEKAEAAGTDLSLPDVPVPVHGAPERRFRIVEMEEPYSSRTRAALDLIDDLFPNAGSLTS